MDAQPIGLSSASILARCVLGILDHMNCGGLLVDAGKRVLALNTEAEKHVGHGIRLKGGHLHAAEARSDADLQALLGMHLSGSARTANREAIGQAPSAHAACAIRRAGSGPAWWGEANLRTDRPRGVPTAVTGTSPAAFRVITQRGRRCGGRHVRADAPGDRARQQQNRGHRPSADEIALREDPNEPTGRACRAPHPTGCYLGQTSLSQWNREKEQDEFGLSFAAISPLDAALCSDIGD